jgi:hypothetical protein
MGFEKVDARSWIAPGDAAQRLAAKPAVMRLTGRRIAVGIDKSRTPVLG